MRSARLFASLAITAMCLSCSNSGGAGDASAADTDVIDTSYEATASAGGPPCGYADNGKDERFCRPGDNCVQQCNRNVTGDCAKPGVNRCESPTDGKYQSFAAGDGTNCGFSPNGSTRFSCKRGDQCIQQCDRATPGDCAKLGANQCLSTR